MFYTKELLLLFGKRKQFEGKEIIRIKSTGEKINLGRKEGLSLKTNNKTPSHTLLFIEKFYDTYSSLRS